MMFVTDKAEFSFFILYTQTLYDLWFLTMLEIFPEIFYSTTLYVL